MLDQIDAALIDLDEACQRLRAASAARWRKGTTISWQHNGHEQIGVVLENWTNGDDVLLLCRNNRTGKTVRVRYSRYSGLYGAGN